MLKKIVKIPLQLQVSKFHRLKTNCWSQVTNKYKLCQVLIKDQLHVWYVTYVKSC